MSASIDKLRELAAQVQLRELRPILMTAELLADFEKGLKLEPVVSLEIQQGERQFFVIGRFGLQGLKAEGEPPIFRFKYHAVAGYALREGSSVPSEGLLREFAETSSMVHLWPYFRAHVQTSASLLQFPEPLILPTFIPGSLRRRVEVSKE